MFVISARLSDGAQGFKGLSLEQTRAWMFAEPRLTFPEAECEVEFTFRDGREPARDRIDVIKGTLDDAEKVLDEWYRGWLG